MPDNASVNTPPSAPGAKLPGSQLHDPQLHTGIIAWFAHNPVAANLLMIIIIVVGLMSLTQIRRELNPDLSIDVVKVTVAYPGASPEEVEQGVTNKIEAAIKDITGIESFNS